MYQFSSDQFSPVQFSHSVVSDSLQPHESQHASPPCPSSIPGIHPNSCLSSRWCYSVHTYIQKYFCLGKSEKHHYPVFDSFSKYAKISKTFQGKPGIFVFITKSKLLFLILKESVGNTNKSEELIHS